MNSDVVITIIEAVKFDSAFYNIVSSIFGILYSKLVENGSHIDERENRVHHSSHANNAVIHLC